MPCPDAAVFHVDYCSMSHFDITALGYFYSHGGSVWDAMPMTFVRFMFFSMCFFDGNGWEMKMWIHPQK